MGRFPGGAARGWGFRGRRRSARALAEGRVLITLDKDFGEIAVVRELPHASILRLVGLSALQRAEVTLRVIKAHGADLAAGAIITAEAGRLRLAGTQE